MNKKLIFTVMLISLLTLGLTLIGCPTEDDDSGGGNPPVDLPANLKNTSWVRPGGGGTLDFKENTIETSSGDFGVWSAKENGKITVKLGDEDVWKYMDEETFCESYSISGDTLSLTGTFTPDNTFSWIGEKTWTRKQ
jgi:hypothetical protein